MSKARDVYVILDNIRSVHNTASIFRTADCAGVAAVYLCGTTPTPIDRFGRERNDFKKVALGAEKSVVWHYFKKTEEAIKDLKKRKVYIVGIEQDERSIDWRKIKKAGDMAVVLGPEVTGLSRQVLSLCDQIAEIPMCGKKESLNVAVAAGVILFSPSIFY